MAADNECSKQFTVHVMLVYIITGTVSKHVKTGILMPSYAANNLTCILSSFTFYPVKCTNDR